MNLNSLFGLDLIQQRQTKIVYKEICERYDLVYFGSVNQHEDEHEMVRGVTLSTTHHDMHYCVGSVQGRDVIILRRTDDIALANKPAKTYSWNILQVDLRNTQLPHTLLDAHHHDEDFYTHLFTKFIRLTKADSSLFENHDNQFSKSFSLYTPPDSLDVQSTLLPPDTTAVIGHHFAHFDYEFFQDRLIVYAPDRKATVQLLEKMLNAGVWLANELEHNFANIHAETIIQKDPQ